MQDLIEAYMSVYDDINEVKGFGGRVHPKMEIDEKRLVPGTPDRAHKFPLTRKELNLVGKIGKHRERMEQELASSRTKSGRRKPNPTQTPPSARPTSIGNTNKRGDVWTADQQNEDFYDIVLDYLLDEGYCKSEENAISMMAAMSEDWIDSIING